MGKKLEEACDFNLDWKKLKKVVALRKGFVPVAIQDMETKEVLLISYVNFQALRQTLRSGLATFWSTSRNELWTKGGTSGSILEIVEIRVNCEQNSLLFIVKLKNGTCHTRDKNGEYRRSCFYRRVVFEKGKFKLEIVKE